MGEKVVLSLVDDEADLKAKESVGIANEATQAARLQVGQQAVDGASVVVSDPS